MELQKVYVPVDIDEFVLDKESLSVPVISGGGMVSQQFTFDANNLKDKGYKILKETDAILLSKEDAEKIKESLLTIINNELPATGKFWDNEEKEPMSYTAAYGSNGARDYMIEVAKQALQILNK